MNLTVPYLALALIALWKEFALYYYHRTMPLWMRVASIFPGVALGIVYAVFALYEQTLSLAFRHMIERDTIFFFFLWNGVIIMLTRSQHNRLVK